MDTTRVSSTAFDGTPHAPAHARRFIRQVLGEWRLNHLTEDAVLLTSELVTNAVLHAGTGIELTCRLDVAASPARLEIEVDDHRPGRTVPTPEAMSTDPARTSGRGLALAVEHAVGALAGVGAGVDQGLEPVERGHVARVV
ncbi:ATP-binding protein, partial [Nonomuraea sp. NPDC001684]